MILSDPSISFSNENLDHSSYLDFPGTLLKYVFSRSCQSLKKDYKSENYLGRIFSLYSSARISLDYLSNSILTLFLTASYISLIFCYNYVLNLSLEVSDAPY